MMPDSRESGVPAPTLAQPSPASAGRRTAPFGPSMGSRTRYPATVFLGIDHLVIAVPDPDTAAAVLEAELGLAAAGGGRHEQLGTWNRLVFLADAYVELIGVFDRDLAAANPIGAATVVALDAGTPGLVTFALATDGARRAAIHLRAAGSTISEARHGERARPDGEIVRWSVAIPPHLGPAEPPFVIEHELAGAEWGDEARAAREAFVHPFGGRARLVGLELAVERPREVAAAYRSMLGIVLTPAAGAEPADLEARVGDHAIRLVRPTPDDPPARIGILTTGPGHRLVDLFGCRFALL
jgi:hypothetical protein